jgi:hypothetical protein
MSTPLIVPYRRHPLSCALPAYAEAQLNELAESIKLHGLKHKIVLCDGMILDGWNRLMACGIAQVPPDFRELMADESAAFVVLTNNIDRRDLTKAEKAFAVVDIFFIVNELCSRSTHETPLQGSSAAPLHWSKATIWPQTKAQLAARAGVKERMMQNVLRIRAKGEQRLIDAVRRGEISVEDAVPLVGLDIDGQYHGLQNHCEGKAEQKATRIVKTREASAVRAEKKRSRNERSLESPPVDESTTLDAVDVPFTGNSVTLTSLRALMSETESNLRALCDALSDANLLAGCESDGVALASACRQYLTQLGSSHALHEP